MSRASKSPPAEDGYVSTPETIRATMSLAHVLTPLSDIMTPETSPAQKIASKISSSADVAVDVEPPPEQPLGEKHAMVDHAQDTLNCSGNDIFMADNSVEDGHSSLHNSFAEDINASSSPFKEEATDSSQAPSSSPEAVTMEEINPDIRDFECANDPQARCMTGQYKIALSRKVISDHFGRNKSCTRLIHFWPLFCRKHYQRATYNNKAWQVRKLSLISDQFDEIERVIPGTKYTVVFKKSEEKRLNDYSRNIAMGMSESEAAQLCAPNENSKSFEAPIAVLRELEFGKKDDASKHTGKNRTLADVKHTIDVIHDMLDKEETANVPSIEFLPQLDAHGNHVVYPDPVVAAAAAAANRNTKKKPSPKKKASPRIQPKGSIGKPSPTKSPAKSKLKAQLGV